jgi:hypothetical protein
MTHVVIRNAMKKNLNEIPRYVASRLIRVLSVALLTSCGVLVIGITRTNLSLSPILQIGLFMLTFVSIIFSSRSLFSMWMKFGHAFQRAISLILFSLCYIFLVSLFSLINVVFVQCRKFNTHKEDTFWIRKHKKRLDLVFFRRMG